jgi:hypothetical protein
MEWHREGFTISDDRSRVDIDTASELLAGTYWGHRRPRNVGEKLIPRSPCFSLYRNNTQTGFARVVTDGTVFSWLSDLVIVKIYRGQVFGAMDA